MTASRTDRASDELKPDSPTTEPKALIPANRSAAHSGIRKYAAVTSRTTQRQTVLYLPGGTTPRNPPRSLPGGPIPPGPPWEGTIPPPPPPRHPRHLAGPPP